MTSSNEDDPQERESLLLLLDYFTAHAAQSQDQVWADGLATVRTFQRLIDTSDVSPDEASALMGVAYVNLYRSSAWNHLAMLIYRWARDRGYHAPLTDEIVATAARSRLSLLRTLHQRAERALHQKAERALHQKPKRWWELW
jgi:hypothetical protein